MIGNTEWKSQSPSLEMETIFWDELKINDDGSAFIMIMRELQKHQYVLVSGQKRITGSFQTRRAVS